MGSKGSAQEKNSITVIQKMQQGVLYGKRGFVSYDTQADEAGGVVAEMQFCIPYLSSTKRD